MRTRSALTVVALLSSVASAACGSAHRPDPAGPEPASPSADPPPPKSDGPAPAAAGVTGVLPMSCASSGPLCVPDAAFARRLCDGAFPDVGLVLLANDTPFTRMYVAADVDAWNADGGRSARTRLRSDEEVLVLRKRTPPAGGIVVGNGGGFLVMRWDGTCYTLEDVEISARKPPATRHAPIPWRYLTERTRAALLESAKVLAAYQRRGKECKGAVSGEVTKACEQADTALSAAIVTEIRGGLRVPTPERLP